VIEWDGSAVASWGHVADELGSEMPFTQPRLESSNEYVIIGSVQILELALIAWRLGLAIGAGVLVADLVLDRWAK